MSIRTRFAPSPTGYLHIGGVRTALFNWLLSKRAGGKFILRIDDTDSERNRTEALQPILDGFRWLGIQWDEGPEIHGPFAPYFQSQRNQSYIDVAMRLLETGHAYPDYLSKQELDAERAAAMAAKQAYVHRGPHRNTPPAECVRLYRENPTTLRFKVPLDRLAIVDDLICGRCEQQTNLLGDPVILRTDNRALYNFASVVDDIALHMTHIVRAREHLANTYVQVLFFEALAAPMPQFAHIPVVNAPKSKEKLSKRKMGQFMTAEIVAKLKAVHAVPADMPDDEIKAMENLNPATVAFYKEMGYLPAAVVNYLGRLGWSLDDKTEFIPLDQMIANFSLERVNDSPASFDPDKLYWLAGEYMKLVPLDEKVAGCLPFLQRAGWIGTDPDAAFLARLTDIVAACGDRIKLYSDILAFAAPILKADVVYDPKAVEKRLKKAGAQELLAGFRHTLAHAEPFDVATLDRLLHEEATAKQCKPADLVHPLRVATTGTEVGFGLFETLVLLGPETVLTRIDAALKL
jgi:nondiscriminating glutamyl-tRNA synthetase